MFEQDFDGDLLMDDDETVGLPPLDEEGGVAPIESTGEMEDEDEEEDEVDLGDEE